MTNTEAARLGEKGFSTQYITQETGLSSSQVLYRLNKAGIRRSDFRNDRCVVLESEVTRMPSSEAFQLHSSRLTARMAGDAFAFYHP